MAQDNFPVQITSPQAAGALLFERLHATERLSEPYCLDLTVVSARPDASADQLLGQPVTVSVKLPGGAMRPFNGLVTRFVRTGEQTTGMSQSQRQLYRYQLRLQPWLWFLGRTADCRIFQSKTVTEIFESVVHGHGFTDYQLSLTAEYQPLEYCVQYRETDLNFLSRLFEAAGIYYFFQHQDGKHVMVLADDASAFKVAADYQQVKFLQAQSGRTTADTIDRWWVEQTVQPGAYATTDFNFETPTLSLLKSTSQSRQYAQSNFEVFEYPAHPEVLQPAAVEQVANIRLAEAQAAYERYHGMSSDCYGLRTGAKFTLTGHPQAAFNTPDYVIIGTEHTIESNQYASDGGRQSMTLAIEAIDAKTPFRPARITPKPSIQGAQTAMVVGASGDEIYTDKYGRVKVQFPWDRYGTQDENSSCWMRVAQVWAGNNWGAMHIPRVGQEVLVSFLEGDPDRPIITGRVYNGDSMPPYALPANMTQSGITSRSTAKGTADNFNEIRFEDKKGSELLNIQAEKDFTSLVKNDETTEVKHDRTDKVGNNETLTVTNDQSTTINGQETRKVAKDRTTNIDGTEKLTVGKDQKINVGAAFELIATDKITLTTGQSSLVMQQDGTIDLKGMTITVTGNQTVTVKGTTGVTVQVSSTSVKLDPAELKLAATMIGINGNAQTQVQGAVVQVSASGMAQISGGLIMIG
ncbi:MAG: type VI secretion system Vgr family protein [Steroidobacteraceae bacterium]